MLIQCPTCSRVYLGITKKEAEQQVIAFNEHYLELKEAASSLYKHGTIDISEFTLCRICLTPSSSFTTSINNKAIHTANPMLCEEILMKKYYKMTDECFEYAGRKLYRIQALVDMPQHDVKAGDLGGYVESYENLCGNAWIADEAKVYGNARVFVNARVSGNASVGGNAKVSGNAWVGDDVKVFDDARVFENARVFVNAKVYENAKVFGYAWVAGNAKVYGNAKVSDAWVGRNAKVFEDATVSGNAKVLGDAKVFGNAKVSGNARVSGGSVVLGDAKVFDTYNVGESE